jgi:preprotein translocase subunit SecE
MTSKTAPIEFLRQVRQEVSKVTWPSRRETITSTIMVLLMVVFMAVFFFLIDQVLSVGIYAALGLGD